MQLDDEFHFLEGVRRAVDLCAAPGSWSQVLAHRLLHGEEACPAATPDDGDATAPVAAPADGAAAEPAPAKIVAVDLQEMAPIAGVHMLQGDITSSRTADAIVAHFSGLRADIVVCDGAPDVTGLHDIDECVAAPRATLRLLLARGDARTAGTCRRSCCSRRSPSRRACSLPAARSSPRSSEGATSRSCERAARARAARRPSRCRLRQRARARVGIPRLRYSQLSLYFAHVCVAKPKSSRNSSVEAFVVCRTFTPPPGCGSPGSGLSLCAPADASSAAHALAAEHVLLDHSYGAAHANEEAGAPARSLIVPFVACGDLAGFDSDASYPLELAAARAAHAVTDADAGGAAATGADDGAEAAADARYVYRAPVQPPIRPAYQSFFERQKDEGADRK